MFRRPTTCALWTRVQLGRGAAAFVFPTAPAWRPVPPGPSGPRVPGSPRGRTLSELLGDVGPFRPDSRPARCLPAATLQPRPQDTWENTSFLVKRLRRGRNVMLCVVVIGFLSWRGQCAEGRGVRGVEPRPGAGGMGPAGRRSSLWAERPRLITGNCMWSWFMWTCLIP